MTDSNVSEVNYVGIFIRVCLSIFIREISTNFENTVS